MTLHNKHSAALKLAETLQRVAAPEFNEKAHEHVAAAIAELVADYIDLSAPLRCSGGPTEGCGRTATVVCTMSDNLAWFACEERRHHGGASVVPLSSVLLGIFREFVKLRKDVDKILASYNRVDVLVNSIDKLTSALRKTKGVAP